MAFRSKPTSPLSIAFGILIAGQLSCSPGADKENGSSEAADKEFVVDVPLGGMNLTAPLISIGGVSGKFVGCSATWKISGSAGKVSAAAACASLVYEKITITEGANSAELAMNGAERFVDSSGNSWSFLQPSPTGQPSVMANFQAGESGSLILTSKTFSAAVSISEGDGPVCNSADPFSLKVDPNMLVTVAANPPKAGFPAGAELAAIDAGGNGKPTVKANNAAFQFEMDFSATGPGIYTYKELQIRKGLSICRISDLKITVKGEDVPPPPAPTRLHMVGLYESGGAHSYMNHPRGRNTVTVTGAPGNVILVVAGYEPTDWTIVAADGIKVEKVYAYGYYAPKVAGVDAANVELHCSENCALTDYAYFYQNPSSELTELVAKIKTKTNLSPATIQGDYTSTSFNVKN